LTYSANLAFLNRASKINVGLGSGSGFKIRPVYNFALDRPYNYNYNDNYQSALIALWTDFLGCNMGSAKRWHLLRQQLNIWTICGAFQRTRRWWN